MRILSSLTNRIFLASAALTLLCMGIAVYLVNVRVTASAENELQQGLIETGAAVDQQRATIFELFTMMARLVADLPKLKAAVDTDDPPTVVPVAAEYRLQVGSDLLLVTNRSGRVLASLPDRAPDPRLASLPTIRDALKGRESATFWVAPEGMLQVVSVPITAGAAPPEILGTLSVGFLLGDALAARLRSRDRQRNRVRHRRGGVGLDASGRLPRRAGAADWHTGDLQNRRRRRRVPGAVEAAHVTADGIPVR